MTRVNPMGEPLGSDMIVAEPGAFQGQLKSAEDGDFALFWVSPQNDGDLKAHRFSSEGLSLGRELVINSYTTGVQTALSADMNSEGGFVVSWVDDSPASHKAVKARLFSSSGVALTDELQLGQPTQGESRSYSAVAWQPNGGFVAVWNDQRRLRAGIFDSSGAAVSNEILVTGSDSPPAYEHVEPDVLVHSNGDFVVAWEALYSNYDSYWSHRRFASDGTPLSEPAYRVGGLGSNHVFQQGPKLVSAPDDGFTVVWAEFRAVPLDLKLALRGMVGTIVLENA